MLPRIVQAVLVALASAGAKKKETIQNKLRLGQMHHLIRTRIYERDLPHWRSDYRSYFLTFNTYKRRELSPQARTLVFERIIAMLATEHQLKQLCVMPDHVHLIVSYRDNRFPLESFFRTVKGASARAINKIEGLTGTPVWQRETYDRIIRTEQELADTLKYIANNPIKAKLVEKVEEYRWYYRLKAKNCADRTVLA